MSTQEIPSQADFRERAKTNDVPIARLIGFEVKDIADGRATVVLAAGPQHANPMGTLHGVFFATSLMLRWASHLQVLSPQMNPLLPWN
jgi:acyl-coenzyme A thioesterase PaaI-like protein